MGEIQQRAMICIVLCMGLAGGPKGVQQSAQELGDLLSLRPRHRQNPLFRLLQNLKDVQDTEPKCLCILIKDNTTPALSVSINTSLALQMPTACHVSAPVSECPALLNLSPSSPDAKKFQTANSSSTASPSSSGSKSSPSSTSTNDGSKTVKLRPEFSVIRTILCSLVILACITMVDS